MKLDMLNVYIYQMHTQLSLFTAINGTCNARRLTCALLLAAALPDAHRALRPVGGLLPEHGFSCTNLALFVGRHWLQCCACPVGGLLPEHGGMEHVFGAAFVPIWNYSSTGQQFGTTFIQSTQFLDALGKQMTQNTPKNK